MAAVVTASSEEELLHLLDTLEKEGIRYMMLGGGTNLVFTRDVPDLVLVRLGRGLGKIISKGEGSIEAGAAASTPLLVDKAASSGSDLSFLAGIPGTLGGAVAGNSGTADTWIGDRIASLKYIHRGSTGPEVIELRDSKKIKAGYRSVKLPGLIAVVSAVIKTDIGDPDSIASKIRDNLARRRSTQPIGAKTSGCFFKNPGGSQRPAGALIEECGLKGFLYGGARVSPVHANFIENYKSASPHDIVVLSRIIIEKVREVHGISLEYEVEMIG